MTDGPAAPPPAEPEGAPDGSKAVRLGAVAAVILACIGVAWLWTRPADVPAPVAPPVDGTGDEGAVADLSGRKNLPPFVVVVLPTCEDRLVSEPCNRLLGGGITAVPAFIDETKEFTPAFGVFLGDATLYGGELGLRQSRLVYEQVLAGTDAKVLSAGVGELGQGTEVVREYLSVVTRANDKTMICANATDPAGRPLLRGWEVARYVPNQPTHERPRTMLFISVVAESLAGELAAMGSDVVLTDPVEALRATVPAGEADALATGHGADDRFLIVQGTSEEADAIVRASGLEFTAVFASRGASVLPEIEPRMVGKTPICYPGRGMRFGIRLYMNEALPNPVAPFVVRFGEALQGRGSPVLDDVMAHLREFGVHDLREAAEKEGGRPAHPDAAFVGPKRCAECHEQEAAQHATSAHAVSSLARGPYSPACYGCHMTGVRHASGWRGPEDDSGLGTVSCEACHGPGAKHVETPDAPYAITLDACYRCHLPERSIGFEAEPLWEQWGHGLPAPR